MTRRVDRDAGSTVVEVLVMTAITAIVTFGAAAATTVARHAASVSASTLERAHQIGALHMVLDRDAHSGHAMVVDAEASGVVVDAGGRHVATYRFDAAESSLVVSRDGIVDVEVRGLAAQETGSTPFVVDVTQRRWSIALTFADGSRITVSAARPFGP